MRAVCCRVKDIFANLFAGCFLRFFCKKLIKKLIYKNLKKKMDAKIHSLEQIFSNKKILTILIWATNLSAVCEPGGDKPRPYDKKRVDLVQVTRTGR